MAASLRKYNDQVEARRSDLLNFTRNMARQEVENKTLDSVAARRHRGELQQIARENVLETMTRTVGERRHTSQLCVLDAPHCRYTLWLQPFHVSVQA